MPRPSRTQTLVLDRQHHIPHPLDRAQLHLARGLHRAIALISAPGLSADPRGWHSSTGVRCGTG